MPGSGYTLHVCFLRPKSRGRLLLTSNSIQHKPRIEAGYLSDADGFDMKVMVEAVKISRQVISTSLRLMNSVEMKFFPGQAVQSDAEIEAFIREKAESIYHPIGTCKMGNPDEKDTVVDEQCRVIGVKGLRVVDSSVMPKLIGGNTNAPTMMMAERVAEMMIKA